MCSGIEAATVAWHPLGWQPQWFAEIEPFPSAVLAARWPGVPNFGDFTQIGSDAARIDLLVGGTPCQSFSVAGLRGGMADARGNLALEFLRLADRTRAGWVVWENVPGVLSTNGGRDFGSFLGALEELGYGWSYRVLDAQYFGVPQRRRRVFVVGYLGDWRRAAAVLFERASLSGDSAPSREARKDAATLAASGAGSARPAGNCNELDGVVAGTLDARASAGGFPGTDGATDGHVVASEWPGKVASTLNAHFGQKWGLEDQHALNGAALFVAGPRRLTPRECERLQGFPDDYTAVEYRNKPAVDSPRYKAIGNSMAVPCMRWIGERIQAVEALDTVRAAA